jgi:hypothetical protein
MKILLAAFFALFFCLGLSAQQASQKKQYAYYISHVSSEDALQKLTEQVNASGKVSDCKYHFKAAKNWGELVFTFDEKPLQSEHDKSNELPNIKELIMNSGLHYEGVAVHDLNP